MKKTLPKKRATRSARPRVGVEPARIAVAALERIRTIFVSTGRADRLGPPVEPDELARRAAALGAAPPPSYAAAMRTASGIGEPESFLDAEGMHAEASAVVAELGGAEAHRYVPFCVSQGTVLCFDRGAEGPGSSPRIDVGGEGELPIVAWRDGAPAPVAAHFGDWLDMIADAREESIENASKLPPRLARLLEELGFRFDYPVVARCETGDVEAIVELIGRDLASEIRGDVSRLFDASGKASLTLNVDEFTIGVSLRTGTKVFQAEDVFRWLRWFRDENFLKSDDRSEPVRGGNVRDLRLAAREPPLVQRGVLHVAAQPSRRFLFHAAAGASADDFYLLATTNDAREPRSQRTSLVLHVIDGDVATTHEVDEPLRDLYLAADGALWGLTTTDAVRLSGARKRLFPLQRPAPGLPWWYGIGGGGDDVLVWGNGALLRHDGEAFTPFSPDASLDGDEAVIAAIADGRRVAMLVCGDRVGALARFDGAIWLPITEEQVIDATLSDLDVYGSETYVLDRDGRVFEVFEGRPPRELALRRHEQAFFTEGGARRPCHAVRVVGGAVVIASDGGVITCGEGDAPVFHAAPESREPMRLARALSGREAGIVALGGPHVWVWKDDAMAVLDLHEG